VSVTARVAGARSKLGPVGARLPTIGAMKPFPIQDQIDAVRGLERSGYGAAWNGEGVGGRDAFVELGLLLEATGSIAMGSAVATMWARPAQTAHGACSLLAERFGDRFVLGLGAGYPFQAEMVGQSYYLPVARMREYLDLMLSPHPVVFIPELVYPRVIAANGPKMLALASEVADGAHPTMVPVSYTEHARAILGPDKLLIVGLPIVADSDPERAAATARDTLAEILNLPKSAYAANLRRLGFPAQAVESAAPSVVDAVVAHGDRAAIMSRVREHLTAGADHVILTPVSGGFDGGLAALESLAPGGQD
jgi:probable F420-dependent oxidoreductase